MIVLICPKHSSKCIIFAYFIRFVSQAHTNSRLYRLDSRFRYIRAYLTNKFWTTAYNHGNSIYQPTDIRHVNWVSLRVLFGLSIVHFHRKIRNKTYSFIDSFSFVNQSDLFWRVWVASLIWKWIWWNCYYLKRYVDVVVVVVFVILKYFFTIFIFSLNRSAFFAIRVDSFIEIDEIIHSYGLLSCG